MMHTCSAGGSATHGARDLMDAAHLGSGVQCDIYKLGVRMHLVLNVPLRSALQLVPSAFGLA